MKKVIYTTIIGKYDILEEPSFIPEGYDFICFTDQKINKPNSIWEIRQVLPLYKDNTRTARKYKILPHRFLPEYDISIWTDGNELVVGDINKLQEKYLKDKNMAIYNHMSCWDKRDCVYEEAKAIFNLGNQNNNWKDDPSIITKQMERYVNEQYPPNNGLIVSGVMFRKHNKKDVINCMETWWTELKYGSRRDQLSFNYAAWKCNTQFNWINQDIRDDGYVLEVKHNHQK
jgi:hypothetical protein|tara:strand:+ start:920 stop:1609 length:690 start_codon:yes stop_codon:yes gene_type:complete